MIPINYSNQMGFLAPKMTRNLLQIILFQTIACLEVKPVINMEL